MIPTNTNPNSYYSLVMGGLRANGYDSMKAFFEREFPYYFKDAQWKSLFSVAPESLTGNFSQIIGKRKVPVMAAYVSYEAEGPRISNEGFKVKSDSMPRMKLTTGVDEKAIIEEKIILKRNGSADYSKIFESFLRDTRDLITGIQSQISYTAYQIESTGKFIGSPKTGGGVDLQYDFSVPDANKKGCGGFGTMGVKQAWSSATANPLGDLQDMVDYAENTLNIPTGNLVFRMNKKTWNLFANHPEVKKLMVLKKYNGSIAEPNLSKMPLTKAEVSAVLESFDLPPIEIVNWKTSHKTLNKTTKEMDFVTEYAFADNTVLLRPAGSIGEVQWMAPTVVNETQDNPVYFTEGGLIGVREINDAKNNSVDYVAEFTGIPVPADVTSMLYLNTAAAAS